jgi:activating signal cointegrator 1
MKVLSMLQPWASLFVLGESKYETRTWKTTYRGPLAIHTSKKVDKSACGHPKVQELLKKYSYTTESLPTGQIIGVCSLLNCLKVMESDSGVAVLEDGRIISGTELFLGDYRIGSYAWEVEDMRLLDEFVPAKGQLGLWEYDGEFPL